MKRNNGNFEYEQAFKANYGIFEKETQGKIKKSKIAILGCGGVGGSVAVLLARSGVENFTISDPGDYEITNLNRQIGCFMDTLKEKKVEVIRRDILRINPDAKVKAIKNITINELEEIIKEDDIAIPAADDFALSIVMVRLAKKVGKPSVIGYPTGALTRICVFMPDSPDPEECFGLPAGQSYETLEELTAKSVYRKLGEKFLRYYREEGEWTEDWFNNFIDTKVSLPQIAPIVWLTSSFVTIEILKIITGKWDPVVAPKHWHITPNNTKIEEFEPPPSAMKVLSVLFEGKSEKVKIGRNE